MFIVLINLINVHPSVAIIRMTNFAQPNPQAAEQNDQKFPFVHVLYIFGNIRFVLFRLFVCFLAKLSQIVYSCVLYYLMNIQRERVISPSPVLFNLSLINEPYMMHPFHR